MSFCLISCEMVLGQYYGHRQDTIDTTVPPLLGASYLLNKAMPDEVIQYLWSYAMSDEVLQ